MRRGGSRVLVCDNCKLTFQEVEWDGVGKPVTYKMLEYGDDGNILFNFCSRKCIEEYKGKYPLPELKAEREHWAKELSQV